MDNTLDALRNLYVALGGSADDVENLVITPELINAVAALVNQGLTDALPAVTAEDNGDVLAVVNGAWGKAAPSGGAGALVITFDDSTGVCDTKWSDINAALIEGQMVVVLTPDTSGGSSVAYQSMVTGTTHLDGKYQIYDGPLSGEALAECADADGYPVGLD